MDSDLKTTKAFQASDELTGAKQHFSSAIEPLQDIHRDVMQLAEKSENSTFVGLKALPIARVGEILKVVERSEMKVVFFGRTSNGKSTVINALLKSKVLPFGAGSTTTAICYIRGRDTPSGSGTVKFGGDSKEEPVESAEDLAKKLEDMNEQPDLETAEDLASHEEEDQHDLEIAEELASHKEEEQRDVQIYWSTAQCPMLKGDIVFVDCPGMNAESEMDAKVIQCCSDADVFVYVANGFTTFETSERDLLAKVKDKISSPSNTFILFNQWDRVEKEGEKKASKVRQQQLTKVTRIMVQDLEIFTANLAKARTFFVSAEQAIDTAVGCTDSVQQAGSRYLKEFERFEILLQKCLFKAAVKTKFGRHYDECQPIVASISTALTHMKCKWMEERVEKVEKKKTELRIVERIGARMELFDQIYVQTVNDALEKVDEMCENFHSTVRVKLLEKISRMQPEGGFDPRNPTQYCKEMRKLLQKQLEIEEEQDLKKDWNSLGAGVVKFLRDPLVNVEEEVRRLEEEDASCQPGSQHGDHAQLPGFQIVHKPNYSKLRKALYFLAGGGLGSAAGAAVGIGLAIGVEAVSFGLATPIAAAIGATALGGLSFAVMKPDTMTEDQAKEEIRKMLIKHLDQGKDDRKGRYRDDLEKYVRSSTAASRRRVEEQKQEHEKAVAEMTSRLQALNAWLSEASQLEDKVKEMEQQLDAFKDTFLLNESKCASV